MDLDGQALPPYASEENKKLDAEIKQRENQLESIEEQLETGGQRVKIMTDHLVNVQQAISQVRVPGGAEKSIFAKLRANQKLSTNFLRWPNKRFHVACLEMFCNYFR